MKHCVKNTDKRKCANIIEGSVFIKNPPIVASRSIIGKISNEIAFMFDALAVLLSIFSQFFVFIKSLHELLSHKFNMFI